MDACVITFLNFLRPLRFRPKVQVVPVGYLKEGSLERRAQVLCEVVLEMHFRRSGIT